VNISRHDPHIRVTAVVAISLIALPGSMAAGHRGAPRPAGTPELAISVTDGQVAVRPGQTLTYQVSLRNTGPANAARLEVTQTLAAGLLATSASGNGAVQAGKVSWTTAVPPGAIRTFRVTARVTKPPAKTMQLATVACAALPGSRQPLVCAAHLDRLPGRAATAVPAGPAHRGGMVADALPYAVSALILLAGGLVAILLRRTRRGRRPSHRVTADRTAPASEATLPSAPNANRREFP
jgi:uncharacterized repeat protein (TIGR01451 family)